MLRRYAAVAVAFVAIGAWAGAGAMVHASSAEAEPLKVEADPLTPEVPNESKPPQQAPELHTMGERLSAFGDTLNTLRMPAWGWPVKLTGDAISAYQDSVDRDAAAQKPPGAYDDTMGMVRTLGPKDFNPNNPNGYLYGPNTTPVISKPPATPWDPKPPTDANANTNAPLAPGDPNGDIRPLDTSPSADAQAHLNRQAMDAAEAAAQGAKQELKNDDVKQSAAAAGGKAGDEAAAAAAEAAKPKPKPDTAAGDKADAKGGDEELSTPEPTIRDRVARALAGEPERGARRAERDSGRRGGRRGDRRGDRRGGRGGRGGGGDRRGDRRGGGRGDRRGDRRGGR